MNAVHGLTQAVWDIRRLIRSVREQGATSISLYGVSLGAYTAVPAGRHRRRASMPWSPASRFPTSPALFHRHSPRNIRARSIEHKIMGGAAENVYRVVSPLRFDPPRSPWIVDSSLPATATGWPAPNRPSASGSTGTSPASRGTPGNHVGYLWSKQVSDFLVASLREGSLTGAAEADHELNRGDHDGTGRQVPLLRDRRPPTCTRSRWRCPMCRPSRADSPTTR